MKTTRIPPLAFRLLAGAITVSLLAGATVLTAHRAERLLRADLLLQARLVAISLCPERVDKLTGTADDCTSPDYLHIHALLMRIRGTTPHCRFLYLMKHRPDGVVIFTNDSDPFDSKDHSPPGQTYDEAPAELHAAFSANQAIVRGPYSDRWGTWVSAFVPLSDPQSMMLGMDIDAHDWKQNVALRAALPAGLAAIAILFGLFVILLQQSRRKHSTQQAELQESEERYRRLIENSHDIIYTLTAEWVFTFVSTAWTALLGHPVDQVVGQPFQPFVHPDDLSGCMGFLKSVIETGQRQAGVEYRVRHADGSWRWHVSSAVPLRDETGMVVGLEGTASDVTERVQAIGRIHALLDESKQSRLAILGMLEDEIRVQADLKRLNMAMEQTNDAVVITDREGAIQYVNPAFERVTGYSRQEALGRNPRVLRSGRHDAEFYRRMWATLVAGKTWRGHLINKRKDGTLYEEDATISPVRDASGNIVSYVAVKRDVTHEVQLETQLQQAQKMESVGRLAGGVAHDFNNLLMGIMGYTELCREKIEPGHPIQEYLAEIINGAKRSTEVTRQLLAFARKQIIVPSILDLNDAAGGMLKLLRKLIGEDIKLTWRPGSDLWPVKLDPSQVDQILANLCVNARDAIDGVGEIILETGNTGIDAEFCVDHPGAIPGTYVFLAVSDDGCGMDQETLALVFEPFFTTKDVGKGTGLGLATVYGIVKQNNGFIYATSEPGKGTTFTIYLPGITDKTVATTVTSKPEKPRGQGETVLLVEDDASVRATCGLFLLSSNYKVLVAHTPEQALVIARQTPGDIQLLLTDVVMPGMDGNQLSKRIREDRPDIKVLFMSGYTADVIAQHGVLDEGVQFIPKPFTHDDLARKLRQVLESGVPDAAAGLTGRGM